jgi:hypothetical protein
LEIFFTPETRFCHSAELESREDSHLSYFLQNLLLLLLLLMLLLHFTVVGVVVDYCRPLLVLMMVRRRTRSHISPTPHLLQQRTKLLLWNP